MARFRQPLKWFVLVVLVAYAGVGGYLYLFQERMVFRAGKPVTATPADWGMPFEEVRFASEGLSLNGWWLPGEPGRPLLLFLHGNTSVLSGLRAHIELFRRLGVEQFLFDYRGYGHSAGSPSEAGVYADALAAREYLTGTRGVDPGRIVYYGHSLGGGAATWLAMRHPPAALILEGSFTSIPDVGAGRYPFLPIRWMSRIFFNNLDRMPGIEVPLLILHSRDDKTIPFRHAEALLAASASRKKELLPTRGTHNTSVSQGGKEVEEGLRRFLDGNK
ncbi:MAG: alpha/beta hydrolase [Magnetococcales bacterium]|nr:alpha/beta hydrolase [Magnetococcales bacterium]